MVWTYTPKIIYAYCDYINRNRIARYIEQLNLYNLAAKGEAKDVAKQIADWEKEV